MQFTGNRFLARAFLVLLGGAVFLPACRREAGEAGLEAGMAALEQGDYDAAARHLERAAKQRPASASAYCNLGIAYWKLDQIDRAASALAVAADLVGVDSRPLELLAQVYSDARRWGEARDVLSRLSNGMPDTPRILTWQAAVEYRAGDSVEARDLLKRALAVDPTYAPALYDMAVLYRDLPAGRPTAEALYKKYLRVADDELHASKAREYLAGPTPPPPPPPEPRDTEPPPESRPALEPVVEEPRTVVTPPPGAVSGQARTAKSLAAAKDAIGRETFDEALIVLNRAVTEDPASADALWELAVLYDKHLKYTAKAAAMYRTFTEKFPDDPRIGRIPAAEREEPREPAPRRDPKAAQAAWERALGAHGAGRLDEAVDLYREAVRLDDSRSNAAYNLGLIYRKQGRVALARDAFEQALAAGAEMPKANYMLAVVYREMNEKSKAIEQAKKAIELRPDYSRAHFLLGLLYRDTLRYAWAREHFQSAVQYAPDRETAREAQAWLDSTKAP